MPPTQANYNTLNLSPETRGEIVKATRAVNESLETSEPSNGERDPAPMGQGVIDSLRGGSLQETQKFIEGKLGALGMGLEIASLRDGALRVEEQQPPPPPLPVQDDFDLAA